MFALSVLRTGRRKIICKMCPRCNTMAPCNRALKCSHCLRSFTSTAECSKRMKAKKARRPKNYKTRAQLVSENERLRKKVQAMTLRLKLFR